MDNLYQNGEIMLDQGRNLQREYTKLKEIIDHCSKMVTKMTDDTNKLHGRSMLQSIGKAASYFTGERYHQLSNDPLVGAAKMAKMFFNVFGNGRASGGNVNSGTPYLIGEKGPEMFVPHTSGNIVPNGSLSRNSPIKITMNINTPDVDSFAKSRSQIVSEVRKMVQNL